MINHNKNRKFRITNAVLITSAIVPLFLLIFSFYYIYNINIYGDFSLSIYQNGNNISKDVEVKGVSFFGREQTLYFNESFSNLGTWHFKEINIKIPKDIQSGKEIDCIFSDDKGNAVQKTIEIKENVAIIDSNHEETSFINKSIFIISLQWLNALQIQLVIVCFVILALYALRKTKFAITNFSFSAKDIRKLRYIIYFLLLVAGTVLRFNNPTDTILAYDYSGHISPAIKFFTNGGFDHHEWAYPYPTFIIAILSIFKDINAVLFIQHILSLFSISAFIIYIENYHKKNHKNLTFQVFLTILGTFIFGILYLNVNFIFYEKTLHHEGMIIPFSLMLIILIIQYLKTKDNQNGTKFYILLIFGLFITSLVQYRFTIGIMVIAAFVLVLELKKHFKTSASKTIMSIGIFVVLYLTVFLPEYYLKDKYEKIASSFAYTEFVFSNAEIAKKIIEKGDYVDQEFDTTYFLPYINKAMSNPNKSYFPSLSYNFDYLKYQLVKPELEIYIAKKYSNNNSTKLSAEDPKFFVNYNNYFKNWAILIIKHYPLEVIKKSTKQLLIAFLSPSKNYLQQNTSYTITNPRDSTNSDHQYKYLADNFNYKEGKTSEIYFPEENKFVSNSAGMLIKILLLFCFGFLIYDIRRKKYSFVRLGLATIITCTIITVAILHCFDIPRYLTTILPFILILIYLTLSDLVLQKSDKSNSHSKSEVS